MIGFYDYTVILTYCGLISSLLGILFSFNGYFPAAVVCMGISLVCDTLDGKVARHKPNRTPGECAFGVQIDSLCDVVSFGVFPAIFCYTLGADTAADLVIIMAYCLCGVIRLAYFNVLAMDPEEEKGIYHGLPIVCMSIIMPLVYLLYSLLPAAFGPWLLRAVMLVFGFLYVYDFRVTKPRMGMILFLCVLFWAPTAAIFII